MPHTFEDFIELQIDNGNEQLETNVHAHPMPRKSRRPSQVS